MKTATLTFHGSHNYGSMLQTYALQKVMTEIFGHNEILNFRSAKQKRMMKVISLRPKLGPLLKDLTHCLFLKQFNQKHRLFEEFVQKHIKLSAKEISTVAPQDLEGYDLICCGSDQIWNPCPGDFDPAYLLPFILPAKKISYAVSMGPGKDHWPEPISKFPDWIRDFDAVSVREEGTKRVVEKLSGRDDIIINCDPVLLLDKNEWKKLIDPTPITRGKYIFLYTVFANQTIIDCAKEMGKKLGLPVVISTITNIYDLFSPFKKKINVGPREFLNLLTNAEMVVTSSFHGTAFSILMNVPFVVVNGMKDNRISNLLRLSNLESRSVEGPAYIHEIEKEINFDSANSYITKERSRSYEYLKRQLN